MKFTQKTCVITDSIDPDIYPDESLYVLWNSFSTSSSSSTISLPSEDDNSTTLRKDYHQLLSKLADCPVFSNVKLSSFFEIEPGFSHFFSSQIFESSYAKSPLLPDLIKLLALKRILRQGSFSSVRVIASSPQLTQSIQSLCQSLHFIASVSMKSLFLLLAYSSLL